MCLKCYFKFSQNKLKQEVYRRKKERNVRYQKNCSKVSRQQKHSVNISMHQKTSTRKCPFGKLLKDKMSTQTKSSKKKCRYIKKKHISMRENIKGKMHHRKKHLGKLSRQGKHFMEKYGGLLFCIHVTYPTVRPFAGFPKIFLRFMWSCMVVCSIQLGSMGVPIPSRPQPYRKTWGP